MAETSPSHEPFGHEVLKPPADESIASWKSWLAQLESAVQRGVIDQHEADRAVSQFCWPYPDEIVAVFRGEDSVTIFDAKRRGLLEKPPAVWSADECRMKPIVGEVVDGPDGERFCTPVSKNRDRQTHRELIEAVMSVEGMDTIVRRGGRPAVRKRARRIVRIVDERPDDVTKPEAFRLASEGLRLDVDDVKRTYRREKARRRGQSDR